MKLLKLFKPLRLSAAFSLSSFSVAMLFTGYSSLLGLINPSKASAQETAGKPFGYVLKSAIWKTNPIPVCWENPSNSFSTEMNWVQNAVANSWQTIPRSNVKFTNWNQCSSNSSGIRIQIDDQGPHTKGLGSTLNGVPNGMVLNFTFQNWSQNCQTTRQRCIELIAIHEFGHALGFAHEQNRPDTPETQPGITEKFCTQEKQGTSGDVTVGAWDLNSVMNYCNPNWIGNGQLSTVDIQTLNAVYGPINQLKNGDFSQEFANWSARSTNFFVYPIQILHANNVDKKFEPPSISQDVDGIPANASLNFKVKLKTSGNVERKASVAIWELATSEGNINASSEAVTLNETWKEVELKYRKKYSNSKIRVEIYWFDNNETDIMMDDAVLTMQN